jgi:hypothetical protein
MAAGRHSNERTIAAASRVFSSSLRIVASIDASSVLISTTIRLAVDGCTQAGQWIHVRPTPSTKPRSAGPIRLTRAKWREHPEAPRAAGRAADLRLLRGRGRPSRSSGQTLPRLPGSRRRACCPPVPPQPWPPPPARPASVPPGRFDASRVDGGGRGPGDQIVRRPSPTASGPDLNPRLGGRCVGLRCREPRCQIPFVLGLMVRGPWSEAGFGRYGVEVVRESRTRGAAEASVGPRVDHRPDLPRALATSGPPSPQRVAAMRDEYGPRVIRSSGPPHIRCYSSVR